MKVYLRTYGCQMNEYDTELVRSILSEAGYGFTDDESEADIVMLNTCSVRENAHRKVFGSIHDIRHRRKGKGPVLIGILGCMATALRKDLIEDEKLPIDFVVGPDSYKRLPQIIEKCLTSHQSSANKTGEISPKRSFGGQVIRLSSDAGGRDLAKTKFWRASHQKKIYDWTLSADETYSGIYPTRTGGINAWLAVMRGCNNFCSFCIVPYTRGRERSRTVSDILSEVKRLVTEENVKQVTLLGQNVNSYFCPTDKNNPTDSFPTKAGKRQRDGKDFADLLTALVPINGLERIRFMSPHPKDFPDKFLDVISNNPKICKHVHLPLQAGNNRILELMNRGYSREDYLALVAKLKTCSPGIALTTDIIVGFPTETDAEYQDTFHMMKDIEFDSAFIFKYSPRKGTSASRDHKDDVSEIKKTLRIVQLNQLQKNISYQKNRELIGQIVEVLIENKGTERSPDEFESRTDGNKLVIFASDRHQVGQLVNVRITDATPHVLKAVPVDK